MKKFAFCALVGSAMLLLGCGEKKEVPIQTVPEVQLPTTAKTYDPNWKDGMELVGFDLNDKNGQRRVWANVGEKAITLYDDNGVSWTELNHGEFADVEYSRKGMTFRDEDNDGYLDVIVPSQNTEFGKYNYVWLYNFVTKRFDKEYIELANEKEVLTMIANGIIGQNSARQITQIFNDASANVLNGVATVEDKKGKAYNVIEGNEVKARLYFFQEGDGIWYIETGLDGILSVITSKDGEYAFSGVAKTEKAKSIAAYTVGDFKASNTGVSQDIAKLFAAAGDNESAGAIQSAISSYIEAYESVRDEEGNRRVMSSSINVFTVACEKLGVNQGTYSNLK